MPKPTETKYVYSSDWVLMEVLFPAGKTKVRIYNLTAWWRVTPHPTLQHANAKLQVLKGNVTGPGTGTQLWTRGQTTKVAVGVDNPGSAEGVVFDGFEMNFPTGMVFGPATSPAVTDGRIWLLLDARAVNGSHAAMETDINATFSFE